MVMVTTSIKVDDEKKEIAKKRGIILTHLLDNALDMALGLELKESTQLEKEKEDLLESKSILIKEKEDFLKDHESKILEIDFKIRNIDKALENAIVEDKEEIKQQEYKEILRMALKSGGVNYRDGELMDAIEEFADKYEMTNGEFEELQDDINDFVINNFGKRI